MHALLYQLLPATGYRQSATRVRPHHPPTAELLPLTADRSAFRVPCSEPPATPSFLHTQQFGQLAINAGSAQLAASVEPRSPGERLHNVHNQPATGPHSGLRGSAFNMEKWEFLFSCGVH